MITITAPTADGDQEIRYHDETLVRLSAVQSVHGHMRYSVSWGYALGQTFRDAGEAFGYAFDRAEAMAADIDATARMRAAIRF